MKRKAGEHWIAKLYTAPRTKGGRRRPLFTLYRRGTMLKLRKIMAYALEQELIEIVHLNNKWAVLEQQRLLTEWQMFDLARHLGHCDEVYALYCEEWGVPCTSRPIREGKDVQVFKPL